MDNPGIYSLSQNGSTSPQASDLAITTAGTTICSVIDSLDGMLAASIEARFAYGSGGTSVDVYIQTSLDQGSTWIDVAQFRFTTASAAKVVNLSGLTPVTTPVTPTDGAMAQNTCQDGILGDRLRAKVVSVGTYAGATLLALRVNAR